MPLEVVGNIISFVVSKYAAILKLVISKLIVNRAFLQNHLTWLLWQQGCTLFHLLCFFMLSFVT